MVFEVFAMIVCVAGFIGACVFEIKSRKYLEKAERALCYAKDLNDAVEKKAQELDELAAAMSMDESVEVCARYFVSDSDLLKYDCLEDMERAIRKNLVRQVSSSISRELGEMSVKDIEGKTMYSYHFRIKRV